MLRVCYKTIANSVFGTAIHAVMQRLANSPRGQCAAPSTRYVVINVKSHQLVKSVEHQSIQGVTTRKSVLVKMPLVQLIRSRTMVGSSGGMNVTQLILIDYRHILWIGWFGMCFWCLHQSIITMSNCWCFIRIERKLPRHCFVWVFNHLSRSKKFEKLCRT